METDTLRLVAGLLILIIINIVLGLLSAIFVKNFNWHRLFRGLAKGGIVIGCFVATYYVGYLNPGIVAVTVSGLELDVLAAVHLVVLVGYYHYAKQVIKKLAALVGGKLIVCEIEAGKNGDDSTDDTPL